MMDDRSAEEASFVALEHRPSADSMFRHLIDAAPDAMVVVDEHGRIAFVNQQTEQLFGYARHELVGQLVENLIPERFRAGHRGHRTKFTAAPKVRPMGSGLDLFGRKKDGSEVPIEISLSPLQAGESRLVCAAIRDISERKKAELEIHHLAAIVDSSDDAIVSRTLDGVITSWNRGAVRLFGYEPKEAIGKPFSMLVPSDREAESAETVRRVLNGEHAEHFETVRKRKDGQLIDVSVTLSPIFDVRGTTVGLSFVARDISERKRMEALSRRASEHLRSAMESIQGAFALFDADDKLALCNSTFRLMFGRHLDGDIVGRSYPELLHANLSAGTFELGSQGPATFAEQLLAFHRSPTGFVEIRTKDGHTLRVTDRKTASGGTVSTIWDITDDVHREEELRNARALAEKASSAKSEFLASMSHELRTPLNAILGFAQLLQRDKKTPLSERQQERLDHILKGGEHLLRLIDDVLDLARIEAGRVTVSLEPVNVPEVLAEVKTTLAPMAARAGVELVVPSMPPGLNVVADRTRFAQILMNYGSNAIKYGRKGGRATFVVSGGVNQRVRVAVADDGVGIPADKHDKIFQPFQRAGQETGPVEGTGIGLTISKRLAEIMGGAVGFQSAPGQGSEFWVELPRHEVTKDDVAVRPESRPDLSVLATRTGAPSTIVYVEDNPSNIAFMEDLIAEFDSVELVTAPTAEIGIELVRARRPDVVIMDINLPGMSGFEATRRLREWPETRDIPVVALSAAAMVRDVKRVEEAGFYRYLTKPVKVDALTQVLEELLVPKSGAGPTSSTPLGRGTGA